MGDSTRKRKMPGRDRRPNVTQKRKLEEPRYNYMKPEKYLHYFTLTEMSRSVDRDKSWLIKLERDGRIPQAHRVQVGQLSVRLWSPTQRDEIYAIVHSLKRGRPRGS